MSITIEKDRIIFERRDELTVYLNHTDRTVSAAVPRKTADCRMRTGRFCRQRKEHVSP